MGPCDRPRAPWSPRAGPVALSGRRSAAPRHRRRPGGAHAALPTPLKTAAHPASALLDPTAPRQRLCAPKDRPAAAATEPTQVRAPLFPPPRTAAHPRLSAFLGPTAPRQRLSRPRTAPRPPPTRSVHLCSRHPVRRELMPLAARLTARICPESGNRPVATCHGTVRTSHISGPARPFHRARHGTGREPTQEHAWHWRHPRHKSDPRPDPRPPTTSARAPARAHTATPPQVSPVVASRLASPSGAAPAPMEAGPVPIEE